VSDFEWQVELAAKGLRERDQYPMPKSVTTPEAFYEVMAGAALEAIDLPALLDRLASVEEELETLRHTSRRRPVSEPRMCAAPRGVVGTPVVLGGLAASTSRVPRPRLASGRKPVAAAVRNYT
jgi:hypothetical protein